MADHLAPETAKGRYTRLENARRPYLDRAREAALLTIPALMPPEGHNSTSKLSTPYQGLGARGVNTLASKLLLALFPPNSPFFRYTIDDFTMEKLTGQEGMRAEMEKALNKMERAVMGKIEADALRVSGFEALKHLLNDGNALVYLPDEGGMRVFKLDRYVVRRDPMGNVLEHITKETISPETAKKYLRADLPTSASNEKTLDLYTHVTRHGNHWKVRQEIVGQTVAGSEGVYPIDKSPWIALRFTKIDGEDYGRGYIEEYLGDLKSLEGLSKAIVQASAIAAKVVFLVNPNGTTSAKVIAEAESGDIKSGVADDVTVLQTEKYADLRIAYETIGQISQRLSFAFLLNTAIQRSGERVTAEEIRYMAGELEDALGGVYSILSQEFQLPLINRLTYQMEQAKQLPKLPKGVVRPTITTGLEALGRGHDMNKLQLFATVAVNAAGLPPEINKSDFLTRMGTALGIDMSGLVKTQEQVMAEQQQAAMMAAAQAAVPGAMNIARDQMDPSKNGPSPQGAA